MGVDAEGEGREVTSDITLSVLGVMVVTLPYVRWYMRERRHAQDRITHTEFMTWLDALERAGYEQARDIRTTVIVARYKYLTSNLTRSKG